MTDIPLLKRHYPLIFGADNAGLRTICDEIKTVTPKIKKLAQNLLILMHEYDGVGLAAPQIGQCVRMAAISQWDVSGKKRKMIDEFVIINPRIIAASDTQEEDIEGCLSLPGIEGRVTRPQSITLEYISILGKKCIHKAVGFNARVILHEIDHLDGVLFIDLLNT